MDGPDKHRLDVWVCNCCDHLEKIIVTTGDYPKRDYYCKKTTPSEYIGRTDYPWCPTPNWCPILKDKQSTDEGEEEK